MLLPVIIIIIDEKKAFQWKIKCIEKNEDPRGVRGQAHQAHREPAQITL